MVSPIELHDLSIQTSKLQIHSYCHFSNSFVGQYPTLSAYLQKSRTIFYTLYCYPIKHYAYRAIAYLPEVLGSRSQYLEYKVRPFSDNQTLVLAKYQLVRN